ncbi:MAG: S8 family serine peptidase [Actinomycetota bacterium]
MTSSQVGERFSKGGRARRLLSSFAALSAVMVLLIPNAASASNDYYYSQQWGLHRVRADASWGTARGSGMLIAVIDSGVYLGHEDLRNKIAPGRDFVDGDSTPNDGNGHGTLVAGIAAAETGNGVGIAGVAPDARIMPVRVFDSSGNADSDQVAAAIDWTVANTDPRRLVLNLSFVGPVSCGGTGGAIFASDDVQNAITRASSKGAAVVAAAGNDGCGTTQYDAPSGSGIIVVGSHTQNDQCASTTNYGSGLDILAPGSAMTTAGSAYATATGTSIAVPFVSGAMALLMSSGMSNTSAVNRLLSTARGPAISCRGESSSYRFLDVGAALGVSLATVAPPAPAPQRLGATQPRTRSARPPRPAVAAPPPAPAPPPLPLITLPVQEPPTIVLSQTPGASPVAQQISTEPRVDLVKLAAASAFAVSAFLALGLRWALRIKVSST